MKLKKPKFWDLKNPNIYAYLLIPLAFLVRCFVKIRVKNKTKKLKIKTICVGNIYIGGTGKTSLCIEIDKMLKKKKIKSCFVKKFYSDQIDEQKLLKKNGKLFISSDRYKALESAENKKYQVALIDDGLQEKAINYDQCFVCFNDISWKGNGLTIPAGPLRENLKNLKNYKHLFLTGNLRNISKIRNEIYSINSKIKIHYGKYQILNLNKFSLKDNYLVFSGIGNHKTFIEMLKLFKFKILNQIEFPDHYKYSKHDITKLLFEARKLGCKIITTEKDYLRLNNFGKNKIKFIKSGLKILNEEKLLEAIL